MSAYQTISAATTAKAPPRGGGGGGGRRVLFAAAAASFCFGAGLVYAAPSSKALRGSTNLVSDGKMCTYTNIYGATLTFCSADLDCSTDIAGFSGKSSGKAGDSCSSESIVPFNYENFSDA